MEAVPTAVTRATRRVAPLAPGRAVAALSAPRAIVATAALVWSAIFAVVGAVAYDLFLQRRFDLGNFTQAVANTAHGHFLEVTDITGRQFVRLGAHVDPILALFAPLWRIWPSPTMLLTVKAIALAAGAVPVFWLGRKHLRSERAAVCLALVYLLYPATQWAAVNDNPPGPVPLLLLAVWYLDEDRLTPFAVVAALALATGEQIGLVVAGLGIWYAIRRRRARAGGAIAAVGLAWTVVAFELVIPHFSGGPSPFESRYDTVGGSPAGIAKTLVTDPDRILSAIATFGDARLLLLLIVPLLGLCFLEPLLLLPTVPVLAMSLLSARPSDLGIDAYVVTPAIPFLLAAVALGLGRLRRDDDGQRLRRRRRRAAARSKT
jgi:uncharacterized membrane protein